MTVTTECTLEVGIVDLRAAISSVVAHAEPPKLGDETLALSRVRLIAGKDELLIVATNSRTTALAAVQIETDSRAERFAADDGSFVVDMHPAKIRDIHRQLKPAKDDEQAGWAELVFTDSGLTARDISGLWPGTSLTVTQLAMLADYPDIPGLLGTALAEASGNAKPLVSLGKDLAAFAPASKAYDAPLQIEPTGTAKSRGFIVLCGGQFFGTVSSRHHDDDSLKRRDRERHQHMTRFGLAAAKPHAV